MRKADLFGLVFCFGLRSDRMIHAVLSCGSIEKLYHAVFHHVARTKKHREHLIRHSKSSKWKFKMSVSNKPLTWMFYHWLSAGSYRPVVRRPTAPLIRLTASGLQICSPDLEVEHFQKVPGYEEAWFERRQKADSFWLRTSDYEASQSLEKDKMNTSRHLFVWRVDDKAKLIKRSW